MAIVDLYDVRERFGRNPRATDGKTVVLIPAYNEERFIGSIVLGARRYADTVLVVDDGSTDATAELAEAAGAVGERLSPNQGKGVALQRGFILANALGAEVVVTLDGDGQHSPREIKTVAAPVREGKADIVVGSRYMDGRSEVPKHRKWGHRLFNSLNHGLSGIHLTDSQSGFRAFSSQALRVFQAMSLQSAGFSVESEMQLVANEHNLTMAEVPIVIQYRDKAKRSVINHGLMVLNGTLRLIGQYRPLFFLGLPGMILLLIGMAWGGYVIDIYNRTAMLAVGYAIVSVLVATMGGILLSTGIILHSVRGLLIEIVGLRRSQPISH